MKNRIVIMALALVAMSVSSCTKAGLYTQETPAEIALIDAVLIYEGTFMPTSGIEVNGGYAIYKKNDDYFLKLVDFTISEGPDLKVYLSMADTPQDFVNLGAMNESTVYSIPVMPSEYSHVLIHCQQYNHLFATATIE